MFICLSAEITVFANERFCCGFARNLEIVFRFHKLKQFVPFTFLISFISFIYYIPLSSLVFLISLSFLSVFSSKVLFGHSPFRKRISVFRFVAFADFGVQLHERQICETFGIFPHFGRCAPENFGEQMFLEIRTLCVFVVSVFPFFVGTLRRFAVFGLHSVNLGAAFFVRKTFRLRTLRWQKIGKLFFLGHFLLRNAHFVSHSFRSHRKSFAMHFVVERIDFGRLRCWDRRIERTQLPQRGCGRTRRKALGPLTPVGTQRRPHFVWRSFENLCVLIFISIVQLWRKHFYYSFLEENLLENNFY